MPPTLARWSQLLVPTLRDAPTGAPSPGHALLVRAGYVRQVGSGAYDLLPLAARAMRKVEAAFRREAETVGAAEVVIRSRQGRADRGEMAALVNLAAASLRSHKQLPLLLHRVGEVFRDEPKPGGGLRVLRHYHAAELLAFARADDAATVTVALRDTAHRLFASLGLTTVEAEDADGRTAFALPCEAGDDALLVSDVGGYAATAAAARTGSRPWGWGGDPAGEPEKIHTPALASVDAVARFLGVEPRRVLKTLVFRTDAGGPPRESGVDPRWVVAVVRGDHEVNVAKLAAAARAHFQVGLRPLGQTPELAAEFAVGFVGPDVAMRKVDAVLVVDYDAANDADWVAGANEPDHHARHFHWFRDCGDRLADPGKTAVADVRDARDGDPSPDGGRLVRRPAIVLATAQDLGTGLADGADARYTDEAGADRPIRIGRLALSFERLLAAVAETSHDGHGLAWPPAVAPFDCVVTPIKYEGASREAADRLAAELRSAGLAVLLDDRDARPGAKFAEADLIGVPVRVNVGDRQLRDGTVEVKARRDAAARPVPIDRAAAEVVAVLASLS